MSKHLSEPDLLDVLEGRASGGARAHVGDCAACRARVEEASGGLERARRCDVPEPSTLYWEAFRAQVGRRIRDEAARRRRVWPAVAALAAGIAVVVLLPGTVRGPRIHGQRLPAWSALPASEGDAGLLVLEGMAPTPEDLRAVAGCEGVADCLADLDDEESRALAAVLRGEIGGRSL
ncbi:MAG: hypothetical protein HY317_02390 [Acidobacteria bacterium]|nr:hypothetical protein [Acidobacteriota bacterium]